jgi:hypothetical protein
VHVLFRLIFNPRPSTVFHEPKIHPPIKSRYPILALKFTEICLQLIYLPIVYILDALPVQFVDLKDPSGHSHGSSAGNASLKGELCVFLDLPLPRAQPDR